MAANPEDTIDPTTHSPRLSALFSYPKHFFTSVLPQQWQNIKDYEYQQKLSELLSNPKFKQGAFITLGIVGILTLPFTLPLLLSAASSVLSLTISAAMFIMRIFMPVMLFNLLNDKLELVNKTHRLIISMLSFINDKLPEGTIKSFLRTNIYPICTSENLRAFMTTGSISMGLAWALFSQASLGLLIASFFVTPACLAVFGMLKTKDAVQVEMSSLPFTWSEGRAVGGTVPAWPAP